MLTESFPQVDPLALEALFEANNYNYGQTVAALNASLGTTPKIKEPEEVKSPSKPKPKPKSTTEVAVLVLFLEPYCNIICLLRRWVRTKDIATFVAKPCTYIDQKHG